MERISSRCSKRMYWFLYITSLSVLPVPGIPCVDNGRKQTTSYNRKYQLYHLQGGIPLDYEQSAMDWGTFQQT